MTVETRDVKYRNIRSLKTLVLTVSVPRIRQVIILPLKLI